MNGSMFIATILGLSGASREDLILREWRSGKSRPSFVDKSEFVTLTIKAAGITGTVRVCKDVASIGDDTDFRRIPMMPATAQAICDDEGCFLPTTQLSDFIWRAAAIKLTPKPFAPGADMSTTARYVQSDDAIRAQMLDVCGSIYPSCLVAGHKKDVVISPRRPSGKVAIYGWHQPSGVPIQPLYFGHEDTWVDYSHGIRLIDRAMTVGGVSVDAIDVLRDAARAGLLSSEGLFGGVPSAYGAGAPPPPSGPRGGFPGLPPGGKAGISPPAKVGIFAFVAAVVGGGLAWAMRD